MNAARGPYLDVLRGTEVLRQALHDLRAAPGEPDNHDQSQQRRSGRLPSWPPACQSAAQSKAEKAEQQGQVLYIGEHANFSRNPTDESKFSEQGEGAC